jgi:hypothetical protein
MKVTDLSIWEQLGSIEQGWSELAANCDASPFTWPTFCLPWWYELGWGRLASMAVEESGLLVGLALLHDRVGDIGRHMIRFVGVEPGTYHQLLVADGRHDVTELMWERLSSGREIDLSAVPIEVAKSYESATSCRLVLSEQGQFGFVSVLVKSTERSPTSNAGTVRKVTDPSECLDLITAPNAALRWGSGERGSKAAAFFASTVHASVRTGRMTLHVEDRHDGPAGGVLVLHGSGTSVVWRHVGQLAAGAGPALVEAATADAAERGSRRLLWPESAGVAGQPFPLTDISRARPSDGRVKEISSLARGAIRGIRDHLAP